MTIEKLVKSVLDTMLDNRLGMTATELGAKSTLVIQDSALLLQLTLGIPCEFLEKTLVPELINGLSNVLPQLQPTVTLTSSIKAHRTQLVGKGLRGVRNIIAVASGKGGVGKSTVAVNLAVALARAGARVGILDADIYGPSIPLMLGKVQPVAVRNEHYLPAQAHGVQAMSIGYLTEGEPALIWRGPMLAKSLIQMIDITEWDELDYLFIDLPPGTGDIQLSLVQKIPLTGAVIVTTPQTVATLDAQKAIKMFAKTGIDVLGIVENMSFHRCNQCGHEETVFSSGGAKQISEQYQVPLLGQLPMDKQIAKQCDEGMPIAASEDAALSTAMLKIAINLAVNLSKKPLNYMDKFPNVVIE